MSRKVWLHLRHLTRRCAWLLASLSSFFFLYTTAVRLVRSLGGAESVAVLPSMLLMFFSLPSLFFSVLCWSKLVARFPSIEAGWAGRLRGAGAIVGVSFARFSAKEQLAEMGFHLIVYPLSAVFAAASAMQSIYEKLYHDQNTFGVEDQLLSFEDFNTLIGVEEKYALAERFGAPS